MARDYAQLRTDIWADDQWRTLTPGAQWLYELILTSPSLSLAGVADWRPSRIAKLARGLTVEAVRKYADELARGRFVVFDDETEEIVARSFLRHDGVLVNPNLWKSLGRDFAGIYSPTIKALVAEEVARLRSEHPTGMPTAKGGTVDPWSSRHLQTLMKSGSETPTDTPTDTGSETPSPTPSDRGSDRGSPPTPTPIPRNASHSSARAKGKSREVALSKDWSPTAEHIERAKSLGVDVISEAESFRLHAEAHDRRAVNWNAAFTMWLKKAKPQTPAASPERRVEVRDGLVFINGRRQYGGREVVELTQRGGS